MRCGARRLARAARGSEPGDIDATRCAMGRKQPCPHPDAARDRARGLRCGDGGRSEQGQCVFGGRAGVLRYMRVRTFSSLPCIYSLAAPAVYPRAQTHRGENTEAG